jgi:hypothetical protein
MNDITKNFVQLVEYYQNNHIRKNEMDRAFRMHGEKGEVQIQFLWGNLKEETIRKI